jgi:hypothetical protein
MTNRKTLKKGSLLLADGTALPDSVSLASHPYAPEWRLLHHINPKQLTDLIQQAGWHCFYLAAELETTAWGWDQEATLQKAIQRITARTKAARYNCVEIKHIEARRWLGISMVKLTAHSRHIQGKENLAAGRARLSYASD